jgi:hypothetical protein
MQAQNSFGKVTDKPKRSVGFVCLCTRITWNHHRCRWNYTISNLPVGSLKLVFEYVGYANLKLSWLQLTKNSLNIVLEQTF